LVAVRLGNAVPRRSWRVSNGLLVELQAVQAQRPLRQGLLDFVPDLESCDHRGELARAVVRLRCEMPLQIKQHPLMIDEHCSPPIKYRQA
jgi:hypothetical protein